MTYVVETHPVGYALCHRPQALLIALGLQILGIVASGSWHFWYPDLSFDMLGGFGTILGLWGAKQRHFEVQAWIVIIF